MTFKEYYREPIKESPDVVYSPSGKKLAYYSRGARAFGTVHGIRDLSPFFIYTLKDSVTHYEMIEGWAMKLEIAYEDYADEGGKDLEGFQAQFLNAMVNDRLWRVHEQDAKRVAQEIVNSKFLMRKLKNFDLKDYIEDFTWTRTKGSTEIEQDLSNGIRTKLYRYSGRVWPEAKVISFWTTEDQLTPQALDDAFNRLKITDKDKYFVDVVNMEELDKEETKRKKLPSYKEYKTRRSAPKKKDISDEQRKRAQEFMSKQHGVQGAQKAKFGSDIPEVGAKRYAKQMPLDVRQQVQTSESKS